MSGIMDYALQIGEEAYQQELERTRVLRMRADYLFKWLSLFIAILNIVVPILVKEIKVDYRNFIFIILYLAVMFCLLVAMLIILTLNYPVEIKRLPTGTEILKLTDKFTADSDIETGLLYEQILLQTCITEQISNNNDEAVKRIKTANIMIMAAVTIMVVFFIYIFLC